MDTFTRCLCDYSSDCVTQETVNEWLSWTLPFWFRSYVWMFNADEVWPSYLAFFMNLYESSRFHGYRCSNAAFLIVSAQFYSTPFVMYSTVNHYPILILCNTQGGEFRLSVRSDEVGLQFSDAEPFYQPITKNVAKMLMYVCWM